MELKRQVAAKLKQLSFLYDAKGDRYRAMAYGRAAQGVAKHPFPLEEMLDFTKINGVGRSIGETIDEIAKTGTCKRLADLKAESPPPTVSEFESIRGVGPKTAVYIWKTYGVATMVELGKLVDEGKVEKKLAENYTLSLKEKRVPRDAMLEALRDIYRAIEEIPEATRVSLAGSIRRGREMVRDADVVVACRPQDRQAVLQGVRSALGNPTEGTVKVGGEVLVEGVPRHVDVSVTDESAWGACLMYLTGSKEHNIKMRVLAKNKGMTLNEYGLWRGDELVASETEAEIYQALGIEYIEPKDRESWKM